MKTRAVVFTSAALLAPAGLLERLAIPQSIPVAAQGGRVGVPYDWSHRHQVFSQPDSAEVLAKIEQDPRYWQQLNRKLYANRLRIPDPTQVPFHSGRGASGATRIDWSESVGTNALNFNGLVSYPAKYAFNAANPAPDCTNDYVVYTLPVSNANSINVMAFNNLYVNSSGTGACSGTTPSVLFAYNASQNNGPLNSSPALSEDGSQIAVVENASQARLNVLKWKSGNVNNTTFGKPYNSSVLANCNTNGDVAPCEYSVQYSGHSATLSSPYIDYANDTAYVSDDNGLVAAISPVFKGGQPVVLYTVSISGSQEMTPPVYDSVSKNIFVADFHGNLYYIRTVSGSKGSCASGSPPCAGSITLDVADNKQVFESPLLDSASQTVFVFSNSSPKATYNGQFSSVVQTTTTLSTTNVATIGPNGNQSAFAGTFNNNYLASPSTGLLYACGTDANNIPNLFAITFSGTSMNTGAAAHGPLSLATSHTFCSPLTEVFNQSTNKDELYLSVAGNCTASINGGCVEFLDITSGFPSGTAVTPVAETGGTGGIIIDNVSNGTSGNVSQTNIYFITLDMQSCTDYIGVTSGNGNCAVKLTQSALQ